MLKIEKLDQKLQEEIIKLRITGFSFRALADKLNNEHNLDLTKEDFQSYFNRRTDIAAKVIKGSDKMQQQLTEQHLKTIGQIKSLNDEMWELFYKLKENETIWKEFKCWSCGNTNKLKLKSYQNMIKVADHLLKQIQHVDQVLGKLEKKQFNITYNYVDLSKKLTQVVPHLVEKLEKQGIIKIKKKKIIKEYATEDQENY